MYSVIAYDGQVYGPVDIRTLIAWCQQGRVVASTHLVETQTGRSFVAGDMPELTAVLAQSQAPSPQSFANPPMGQPQQQFQTPYQTHDPYPPQNPYGSAQFPQAFPSGTPAFGATGIPKSKTTALWLCFLVGGLGVHRFYLGHTVSAIAMLVVGLLALDGNWLFIFISLLWTTIDFCRIAAGSMADAQGVVPR